MTTQERTAEIARMWKQRYFDAAQREARLVEEVNRLSRNAALLAVIAVAATIIICLNVWV